MKIKIQQRHPMKLTFEEMVQIGRLHLKDGDLIPLLRDARSGAYNKSGLYHNPDYEDDRVFLAKVDDKIVGWSILSCCWDDAPCMEYMIYVQQKYRRQGIGHKLTAKAKSWAKRKKISIHVNKWSQEATSFFKSEEL